MYLAREISRYHKSTHSGIGMPPLTAWELGWKVNGVVGSPRVPDNGENLLTFLPGELRTVTREGIELFSLRYQSADLALLVCPKRKRMVRFDPRDMSRVFVEADDRYVIVNLAGAAGAPFSIWEWREVRTQQIEAGRPRDPEDVAAELAANRSLIASKVAQGDRLRDARRLARQDEWQRAQAAQQPMRGERFLVKCPSLLNPRGCRVEE